MLDLKLIRSQSETIAENCKNRNLDLDIPELLRLDAVSYTHLRAHET